MENEDLIREQMTDTRTSMTEKLEQLEEKVAGTVTGATGAVQDTVEAVKETVLGAKDAVTGTVEAVKDTVVGAKDAVTEAVETVKETVAETVGAVRDTVEETIGAVKDSVKGGFEYMKELFNIPHQTQRHPWLVLGASVASGFCLGRLLAPRSRTSAAAANMPAVMSEASESFNRPSSASTSSARHSGNGHRGKQQAAASASSGGLLGSLFGQFGPELTQLKNMAVGMVLNSLRDTLSKHLPEQYSEQAMGILDNVTAKLTGEGQKNEESQGQDDRHQDDRHSRQGNRQRSKFERH